MEVTIPFVIIDLHTHANLISLRARRATSDSNLELLSKIHLHPAPVQPDRFCKIESNLNFATRVTHSSRFNRFNCNRKIGRILLILQGILCNVFASCNTIVGTVETTNQPNIPLRIQRCICRDREEWESILRHFSLPCLAAAGRGSKESERFHCDAEYSISIRPYGKSGESAML